MRLRWKEPERAREDSAVRDCCRLGRGMALGFEVVGVAALSLELWVELEARTSVPSRDAADIRFESRSLSFSRPSEEYCGSSTRHNGGVRTFAQCWHNYFIPGGFTREGRARRWDRRKSHFWRREKELVGANPSRETRVEK